MAIYTMIVDGYGVTSYHATELWHSDDQSLTDSIFSRVGLQILFSENTRQQLQQWTGPPFGGVIWT